MRENGSTTASKVRAHSHGLLLVTDILASGSTARKMVKERSFGQMETNTKATGPTIGSMV